LQRQFYKLAFEHEENVKHMVKCLVAGYAGVTVLQKALKQTKLLTFYIIKVYRTHVKIVKIPRHFAGEAMQKLVRVVLK
jgi:hypothetical protein